MRKTCPRCTRIINLDQPLCGACLEQDNRRRAQKKRDHGINTAGWQRWRATVLTPAAQCEQCGATSRLSLHFKPGGRHTRNRNDYTILCLTCHGTVDAPRAHLNT